MKKNKAMPCLKPILKTALLAFGGLTVCNPVFGQEDTLSEAPVSPAEALVVDGQNYAKTYGVPLDEAMRRVLIMAGSEDELATLQAEEGDNIAGLYFDNGPDFGLVVNRVGNRSTASNAGRTVGMPRQAQAANAPRRNPALPEQAVARATVLIEQGASAPVRFKSGGKKGRNAVRKDIELNFTTVRSEVSGFSGIGYSERLGAVVVQVVGSRDALAPSIVSKVNGMFDVPVVFEGVKGQIPRLAAQGGRQILNAPTGSYYCTTAFNGHDASNRAGIFTAAHCNDGRDFYYRDTDGKSYKLIVDTTLNFYTDSEDILFLRLPTGLAGSSSFQANKTEFRSLTGRRTITSTTAEVTDGVAEGTFICFFGQTSGPVYGQGCGEVKYKQFKRNPASYPGMGISTGPSSYVHVQGPTTSMRCGPGDSGAPWFALTVAFGIMNNCGENWVNGTDSAADYTSMDAAYAVSYRLRY